MAERLRAGVIGAGVFGGYHASKWAAMEGAGLTAVFDTHFDRAQALAAKAGGVAFANIGDFLDAVDVVSITSPATSHGACALQALRAGKHVYVEKPLAATLDDADAIQLEAARRRLVVACGFSERVAIETTRLYKYLKAPSLIEATRFGTPSPRNRDVSVVLDLMIHDIDLALTFTHGAPLTVEAEGTVGADGLLDAATADVTFSDGMVAILRASRIAEAPQRTLRMTYPSGVVEIDLLAGSLKNDTTMELDEDFATAPGVADQLRYSLECFFVAIKGADCLVADARDGAAALDLALAVENAARSG